MLGRHKSSLERQIKEALAIERIECDLIMNGKAEWGLNLIPRLQNAPTPEGSQTQNNPSKVNFEPTNRPKRSYNGFTKDPQQNTPQEQENPQNLSKLAPQNQPSFESQFKQRKRRRMETQRE